MKSKCITIFLIITNILCLFSKINFSHIQIRAIEDVNVSNITDIKPEISAPFIDWNQTATVA